MRRHAGAWSWKETAVGLFASSFLAAGAWLAFAAAPLPASSEPLAGQGSRIFRRERCAFCHSLNGESTRAEDPAQNGPDLREPGRRRSDDWHLAHLLHPDLVVAGSTMPSYARLAPDELRALIAYLQSFAPPAPSPSLVEEMPSLEFSIEAYRQGRHLYDLHCSGCHGPQGKGNGVVGAVLDPEPRDLTDVAWLSKQSDARLFAVLAEGLPGTAMPGYREALTPEERMLVVYYMRAFGDPLARQYLEQGFFYPLTSP
ncbi:MAG TPA: c-type cytochrome [Anaerolineales bacterium]|nr:c-type cytochrome [Anaerolineales bacterium]